MIISTDMVALVVGLFNRPNGPAAADDGMRFEQFHRAVGTHLRTDDRTEVVLQIERVDRRLGAVGIGANLQLPGKLLILVAVPMKADTNAHVLENERVFPLLKLNMRSRYYSNSNVQCTIYNLQLFILACNSHVRKRSLYQLLRFMATMSQLASELSSQRRQLYSTS